MNDVKFYFGPEKSSINRDFSEEICNQFARMALSESSPMEISYGIDKYNYGDRLTYKKIRYNPLHVLLASGHATYTDVNVIVAENLCFLAEKTPQQDNIILFDECALHFALRYNCTDEIIKLILVKFPKALMMTNSEGMTPYQCSFQHRCHEGVIKIIMQNTVHLSIPERYFLYTHETNMKELLLEVAIRNKYGSPIVDILMRQTMLSIKLSGVNIITHERNSVEGLPDHLMLDKHESRQSTWYITPFSLLERKPNFARNGEETRSTIKKIHIGLNTIELDVKTQEEIIINIMRSEEAEKYFHEMLALIKSNWSKRIIYSSLKTCMRYQTCMRGPIKTFSMIATQLEQHDFTFDLAVDDDAENEQLEAMKIIQKILDNNDQTNDMKINDIKNIKRILHLLSDAIRAYKMTKLDKINSKKYQHEEAQHEKRLEKIAHEKSDAASKDLLAQEEKEEIEKSGQSSTKKCRRIKKKTINVILKLGLNSEGDAAGAPDSKSNVTFSNAYPREDSTDIKSEKKLPTPTASHDLIQEKTDCGNDEDMNECLLCMESPKTTCFVPCGHLCVCSACAGITMI